MTKVPRPRPRDLLWTFCDLTQQLALTLVLLTALTAATLLTALPALLTTLLTTLPAGFLLLLTGLMLSALLPAWILVFVTHGFSPLCGTIPAQINGGDPRRFLTHEFVHDVEPISAR